MRIGVRNSLLALGLCLTAPAALAAQGIAWQAWNAKVFAQAKAQHRFVLLDLQAVWCHWCHVMDTQTYADPAVIALMGRHYIAVKVDQDADPDLSNRYGDYGWPATIVFAEDGSEIVKRRGYFPPVAMASMLQAIIDDPSPGPSVQATGSIEAAPGTALDAPLRKQLQDTYVQGYDRRHGGWGRLNKFIDGDAIDYALIRARAGDHASASMARQTVDAARGLIDPVWGGVDQYAAKTDWSEPHVEKIMSSQATDLRIYSQAYAQWHRPVDLQSARAIHGYLDAFLRSPDGSFYVSQDADLGASMDGAAYYALDDRARRKHGVPRVDTHVYARENGWAIRALTAYYDASDDAGALAEATVAANRMIATRSLGRGGFRHDAHDAAGPYLGDTLAMAEALLDLYRSSGDRRWLASALASLDFIDAHFLDRAQGGYLTASIVAGAQGVLKAGVRLPDEQVALVRVARLAHAYTGDTRYQAMATHAMRYLAAYAVANPDRFLPGVLVADAQMRAPPLHVTVVGRKDDPAAKALHAAALAYPAADKQVDWWDRREGPLPDRTVTYPQLPHAAAFVCTDRSCSLPIADATRVSATIRAQTAPPPRP